MALLEPDWNKLWRELVERSSSYARRFPDPERAARYQRRLRAGPRHRPGEDQLVDFVASQLTRASTVIDIGAAAGRWAVVLARHAGRVTAIEPSEPLRQALQQHASDAGVDNIDIVASRWEDCQLEPHDVVLNSHAMYGSPDFAGLVRAMQRHARHQCFMVMRAYDHDGIMGELCRQLYGHPHDSPNFEVGYNALLGMGIYADVLVSARVKHWVDDSTEAALGRAKRHLCVDPADESHDALFRRVLARRLSRQQGQLSWPDGVRSVLVWWSVEDEC